MTTITDAEYADLNRDKARLDWLDAHNVRRLEAICPYPPSLLWRWHVFLGHKDASQGLNSIRAAIDKEVYAEMDRGLPLAQGSTVGKPAPKPGSWCHDHGCPGALLPGCICPLTGEQHCPGE